MNDLLSIVPPALWESENVAVAVLLMALLHCWWRGWRKEKFYERTIATKDAEKDALQERTLDMVMKIMRLPEATDEEAS